MSNGTVHALNTLKESNEAYKRLRADRDALRRRIKKLERLCAKVWMHGLLTTEELKLVEQLCEGK